ncbi:hypothetical protein LTR36_002728 [Oleoguttula mirabilis]|uniref:Uncharacterized protein n=1 Tax=Oleoguttula mirabilis TaxID=1507867 RepID=A0AAV9JLE9_9PEZI|nr:hypothetical protein LTR36_002728 [Oleoguttula mirabilis]
MSKLISLIKASRKANTNPPLLGLPGEIRNLIYTFVFANVEQDVILPIIRPKRKLADKLKRKLLVPRGKRVPHLALLMTCRQIRAEAFGYVHGTVHTELVTDYGPEWLVKRLLSNSLRQEMKRALRTIGEALAFVEHLEVTNVAVFAELTGRHDARTEALRHSHDIVERRYAMLSDQYAEVRRHLPNLRCVTISEDLLDSMSSCYRNTDWWLALVLLYRTERERAAVAFPRLTEMRLQSKTIGKRFRKQADGEWYEWYCGAKIICLDK